MAAHVYKKLEKVKDGKKLNLTIQQVTPDMVEPVIQHMVDHFLPREPLSRHSKVLSDPVSVKSFCEVWRSVLKTGGGLVVLLDQGSGTDPLVVGANVTGISRKSDPPASEVPGDAVKYVVGAVYQLVDEGNLWERYGVDCYLTAVGLSVHKDYHGLGLGADIVRAREQVCEKFGLPMAVTVFTAGASQHIAAKDGYEVVVEHPYKDFNFAMSDVFRDLEGKINLMVKKFK